MYGSSDGIPRFRIFMTNPKNMATTSNRSESYIDVRFSKFYAAIIIFMSLIPLFFAVEKIISQKQEIFQGTNFIFPAIGIVLGLLFFFMGISMSKRRYFRLDMGNKILIVYSGVGSWWSSKYPYDSIYLAGEKFHIEKEGVKKKVGLLKYTCNKDDLQLLIDAIK